MSISSINVKKEAARKASQAAIEAFLAEGGRVVPCNTGIANHNAGGDQRGFVHCRAARKSNR